MNLSPLPIQKFFDSNGAPLVGGRLFTYVVGTSTKIATYKDQAGTLNANPVPLDYRGEANVWLDQTLVYKFVLAPPGVDDPPTQPIWTVDNISAAVTYASLTAMIIGQILWPRNSAEIAAGVTPTNYGYPWYIRGRYANFTDWRLACDQAGEEGLLEADYTIAADTALPNRCDFRGHSISGSFYTSHDLRKNGWVKNWNALQPRIRGAFFCKYTNIYTGFGGNPGDNGFVEIWGGDGSSNPGTFWNDIHIAYTTITTINANNFDVNQNLIHGGITRGLKLTGGGGGTGQIHGNTFKNLDFTNNGSPNPGVLQNDTARRRNRIEGCYYENGSTIEGNFDIDGLQADGDLYPKIDRFNHAMGMVGINQKISRDLISLATNNLAVGGEWDILDASDKPESLATVSGGSISVQVDNTEPGGAVKRYQSDFSAAFSGFQFTIQPSGSDRFAIVLYYKSTADFVAIESNDGSGAISDTPAPVTVDSTNNWKRIVVCGPASKTATTSVTLFAYGGVGGAAKTMSIGSFFAGSEKAIRPPTRATNIVRRGNFLATITGINTVVQGTVDYELDDRQVTLTLRASLTGTSNATTCTMTGLPTALIPARNQGVQPKIIVDNGATALGRAQVESTGVITFYPSLTAASTGWTNAGTKTIVAFNETYLLS